MTTTSDLTSTGTTRDPAVRASAAIRDISDRLLLTYQGKAALVTDLCLAGTIREQTYAALVDFTSNQVQSYLAATDRVCYGAAAGAPETRLLVRALRRLRESITEHLDELVAANSADQASHAAQALSAVLRAVVDLDQNVLLPVLAELPGIDLAELANDLRTLLGGGELAAANVIDIRSIPHSQRHPRIFGRYVRLAPGDSFVLISNHDPKPLHREFAATYPGAFTWDYLESGPVQWRVRIGRPAVSA